MEKTYRSLQVDVNNLDVDGSIRSQGGQVAGAGHIRRIDLRVVRGLYVTHVSADVGALGHVSTDVHNAVLILLVVCNITITLLPEITTKL